MNIEQRQVTTINLQDGKAREFVVNRDGPVCTISGVCGDEVVRVVMSPQDYQRLAHTLGQAGGHDPGPVAGTACADGTTCDCGSKTGIHVERRQVTTVTLVPSRTRDFVLTQDERGYTLTSLSREEVVTLHLTVADYHKLRQQVIPHGAWNGHRETGRETQVHGRHGNGNGHGNGHGGLRSGLVTLSAGERRTAEPCTAPAPPASSHCSPYVWTGIDWLGYN